MGLRVPDDVEGYAVEPEHGGGIDVGLFPLAFQSASLSASVSPSCPIVITGSCTHCSKHVHVYRVGRFSWIPRDAGVLSAAGCGSHTVIKTTWARTRRKRAFSRRSLSVGGARGEKTQQHRGGKCEFLRISPMQSSSGVRKHDSDGFSKQSPTAAANPVSRPPPSHTHHHHHHPHTITHTRMSNRHLKQASHLTQFGICNEPCTAHVTRQLHGNESTQVL